MSFRDTLVQLGFVMIALGACFATWALLTGPLGRYTGLGPRASARRAKAARSEPRRVTRGAGDAPRT